VLHPKILDGQYYSLLSGKASDPNLNRSDWLKHVQPCTFG